MKQECCNLDKELFLREKMFSIYMVAVKILITFSSSALVFSVGFFHFEQGDQLLRVPCLFAFGWLFLILSIAFCLFALRKGKDLYIKYFSNLREGKDEFDGASEIEKNIDNNICLCFLFLVLGVAFILFGITIF
jgi:hypothetical protein